MRAAIVAIWVCIVIFLICLALLHLLGGMFYQPVVEEFNDD